MEKNSEPLIEGEDLLEKAFGLDETEKKAKEKTRQKNKETEKNNKNKEETLSLEKNQKTIKKKPVKSNESLELKDDSAIKDIARPELKLLTDLQQKMSFIGRKKSVFDKYGEEASLHIGRIAEPGIKPFNVFLDSLHPHVIFVCGARGSGKSYVLGVIAEELSKKNKNVGAIVVDPVGVFWSMKFPNKEEKEVELLKKWGLTPAGLDNLKVFIPEGNKDNTPKNTYDKTFSLKPGILTSQDWALTFGIERFSPIGLLLEKVLEKVRDGYTDKEKNKVKGKSTNYSLEDIIKCLVEDEEINSREKGYKPDSVRALVSRFEAAKSWGIFNEKGTPLTELSREGQLTVIDTSFLDDSVTSLVIGLLARRILAARKIATRKEAAESFQSTEIEDILEMDIPPTWLFIDEAHTLIPSGNIKTPATDSIIEYVKQGRRPGCSLVFATQQPAAINTQVLSQLDIILVHKLIFNDDIKAVFKRTPTIIPHKFKLGNFVKTLPVGRCLVGDRREETSRAFVMAVRPRKSQHEGREAETTVRGKKLSEKQIENLLTDMIVKRIAENKDFSVEELELLLSNLNRKHSTNVKIEVILKKLEKKGLTRDLKENSLVSVTELEQRQKERKKQQELEAQVEEIKTKTKKPLKEEELETEQADTKKEMEETELTEEHETEKELFEEQVELLCFSQKINRKKAKQLAEKERKKRFFGVIGSEEYLESIELKHLPVYHIEFEFRENESELRIGEMFIDSVSGEFLHLKNNKFIESNGLSLLYGISLKELAVLNALGLKTKNLKQIAEKLKTQTETVLRELKKLEEKKLIESFEKKGEKFFSLKKGFDVPPSPFHPLLVSPKKATIRKEEVVSKEREKFSIKQVTELLETLWKKLKVRKIKEVYWPAYKVEYKQPKGDIRTVYICAFSGEKISFQTKKI